MEKISVSGQRDVKQFIKQYENVGIINNWENNGKVPLLLIF